MATKTSNRPKVIIYGLYTDRDETIRYVGKTKFSIKKRLYEHVKMSTKSHTHKNMWIQKCLKNQETIQARTIEECDENNWEEREIYWINKLNKKNKLTNQTVGGEGGHHIIYAWSYKKLKKYVRQNYPHIDSKNKWSKEFHNNINRLDFIPGNPDVVYKQRGWISWGDFLGTNRIQSNTIAAQLYLNYEDAKKYLKNLDIHSSNEYKDLKRSGILSDKIPLRANRYYQDKGWVSWSDFLGNNNISNQSRNQNYLSYKDAKKWLQTNIFLLNSRAQYFKLYKTNNILKTIMPQQPDKSYDNWISWGDFLGTNKISDNQKHSNYLSYNEAKEYINKHYPFIKNGEGWFKYYRENNVPPILPMHPEVSYKKSGCWKGWKSFLN